MSFCTSWRQRIEAIDPSDADARTNLNALYSELVGNLRNVFQAATFASCAPPLNPKKALEASDPETPRKRLWKLITHYPAETTANPIWNLLALGGTSLAQQGECDPDEEELVPLAQMPMFWHMAHAQLPDDCYQRLKLGYTALLPAKQHPFYEADPVIRALYATTGELDHATEATLLEQTEDLSWDRDTCLKDSKEVLSSKSMEECPPAGLKSDLAAAIFNALLPVYFDADELLELSLADAYSLECDDLVACFLDASPLADLLASMSKTRLVKRGVHVGSFTLFPDEIYRKLAKHRNSTPQSEVACCLHTPSDVLEDLAQSMSKEIIYPLAFNPMTPQVVLQGLLDWGGWGAKTAHSYVRANPAYGNEAWQLMEMGRVITSVDQRKQAVLLSIVAWLEQSTNIAEALRLLINTAVFTHSRLEPSQLRLALIEKGHANHDLLITAAWSWHWRERLAVANSPHAPEAALEKLRNDGLAFIRHAASKRDLQRLVSRSLDV